MKIELLFEEYLNYLKVYRAKGTLDFYSKTFISLKKALEFNQISSVSDLSNETLDRLVMYYRKTGKKNNKINSIISAFTTVLRRSNIIDKVGQQVKLANDRESFKVINDYDLKLLFRWCKEQPLDESNNLSWILSIKLMLDTGIRLSELYNIRSKDVDVKNKSITLKHTKNGSIRTVYYGTLSDKLVEMSVKKNKGYLMWNYINDERLNYRSLEYLFDKIQNKLKLKNKIHAHRLRKTFATKLLKSGCPITSIQRILGHSSITQTMIYLEITDLMAQNDYIEYYPYK